jgi:DNA modification methylase
MSRKPLGMKIRDRVRELRRIPARELLPNPKNWRRHPEGQRAILRGVLSEIGYADALLVRETPEGLMLIDGHLRAEETPDVAVPVLVLDLTEEEADTLLATLDPLAGMAEMDAARLDELLQGIQTESEAVAKMLSDLQADAQKVLGPREGLTDPDDVPEPPEEPVSKRGDIWLCGDHRLMCGDSADRGDVARLMAGETATLMVTDPPYGVAYETEGKDPRWRRDGRPIANDDLGKNQAAFYVATFAAWPLQGDAYVFSPSGPPIAALCASIEAAGIEHHQWLIWVKHQLVLGRSHYHYRHEHIFYGWKEESSWNGSRKEDSIWEADRPMKSPEHPIMKPVALCERAVENSSRPNDLVIDPFLGSGTTMIAAERTGRRCYGMEIEPRYVDVGVRRWEEFTGRKAERK